MDAKIISFIDRETLTVIDKKITLSTEEMFFRVVNFAVKNITGDNTGNLIEITEFIKVIGSGGNPYAGHSYVLFTTYNKADQIYKLSYAEAIVYKTLSTLSYVSQKPVEIMRSNE